MGQYTLNNVELELSSRLEHQKVAMDYDWDYIEDKIKNRVFFKGENLQDAINHAKDATQPHNNIARSYGLGVHWHFAPRYTLSFNTSHQERLPNPQELYTHGMHLATNSFEIGNRHLKKERANNYELGLKFTGDKLDYKLASYLYDFDNYIYLQTINEHLGTAQVEHFRQLRINRYDQSKARFYGVEGNIGYQINPKYRLSLFEDYVYGRLHDLPDIVVKYSVFDKQKTYGKQPDRYTPRLPPARLGTRLDAVFNDNWSGNVSYIRTFDQNKVAKFETPTKGNHNLSLGVDYQNFNQAVDYSLFFRANNLLNEKVYAHETHLPYIPQIGRNVSIGANIKL